MNTNQEKPSAQDPLDPATVLQARAIQLHAGTPSAVEYLKARDVEGSVIERLLADDLPAPQDPQQTGQALPR